MHAHKWLSGLLAAAVLSAAGCAAAPDAPDPEALSATPKSQTVPRWQRPPEAGAAAGASQDAAAAGATDPRRPLGPPGAAGKPGAAASPPANASSAAPPPSLQAVIAEIEALGDVDPQVQKRLLENLRQSDPALWPMMTQQIRASLAYQKQQAAKAAGDSRPPSQAQAAAPPASAAAQNAPQAAAVQPRAAAGSPATAARQTSAPNSPEPQTLLAAPASAAQPIAQPETAAANPAGGNPTDRNSASANSSGAVQQVAYEQPVAETTETKPAVAKLPAAAGDWNAALAAAIAALESQTREPAHDAESTARQVYLRMLYLAAGRRDEALRPIPGIAAGQQDYWSKQLFALSAVLDSQTAADPGRRAAEAALHLSHAAASLGQLGQLTVKNLSFCTEVVSYGVYKRFENHEFKPGQQLLVYAEVENFKSEESAEGFHTSLQSSYQILDSQGRRVAHDDFALTEEHCQNRRRDYFVRYFLTLPAMIYDGRYTLELTIEDTLGRKIGQSTIEFSIHGKPK